VKGVCKEAFHTECNLTKVKPQFLIHISLFRQRLIEAHKLLMCVMVVRGNVQKYIQIPKYQKQMVKNESKRKEETIILVW